MEKLQKTKINYKEFIELMVEIGFIADKGRLSEAKMLQEMWVKEMNLGNKDSETSVERLLVLLAGI